ncbi:MAG: hypothetical protein ACE5FT_07980 [Candidatus Nanoarchaeia archaeon]
MEYYPADEQGIKKEPEDKELAMAAGEESVEPDEASGRQELRDNDEISDAEEGFLKGASGVGSGATCAKCDAPLSDDPSVVEKEVDGEVKFFCSDDCANA